MVSLDDAVIARLARHGKTYEILVDPDAAAELNVEKVEDHELRDVMAIDDVFIDWSEGERAPEEDLLKAFNTTDELVIARRILRDGEIQLTAEQRKAMLEAKHKRIVQTIAREAWNPRDKMPHPRDRIERGLEEAKFRVEPLQPVEAQITRAMAALRPLMPIAFEQIRVAIRVPAEHAGAVYGQLRGYGDVKQEQWQEDGSLIAVLRIPAGTQTEVYERLNGATQGTVETKLLD